MLNCTTEINSEIMNSYFIGYRIMIYYIIRVTVMRNGLPANAMFHTFHYK